jgi:hypothetical protein
MKPQTSRAESEATSTKVKGEDGRGWAKEGEQRGPHHGGEPQKKVTENTAPTKIEDKQTTTEH